MFRRSRDGCIECRRSRIKCDEKRPYCGTCARRRRVCQGYASNTSSRARQDKVKAQSTSQTTSPSHSASTYDNSSDEQTFEANIEGRIVEGAVELGSATEISRLKGISRPGFKRQELTSICDPLPLVNHLFADAEELAIGTYFDRHSNELTMGKEFATECNGNVVMLLHRSPEAIGDILYAIGQTYLNRGGGHSLVPALDRRGRVFTRLRSMADSAEDLEVALMMILGLAATELIDTKSSTTNASKSIPSLVAYAATLINNWISNCLPLSNVAKFFIRAVARQDLIIALTQRRPLYIRTAIWLDEESPSKIDRFMGYTITLMPLLEQLCQLAVEVGHNRNDSSPGLWSPEKMYQYSYRAAELRARIDAWRPIVPKVPSFRSSRKFFLQAYAYRSAALLYLHRLFFSAQTSIEADDLGLTMAYDILSHLNGAVGEMGMFLWPAFIAACELSQDGDRAIILEVFDRIYGSRSTTSIVHTRKFVVDRVWKARDQGQKWNWIDLVDTYPEEFMPF